MYYLTQKNLFIKLWCTHLNDEETKQAVTLWENTIQAKVAEFIDACQGLMYAVKDAMLWKP